MMFRAPIPELAQAQQELGAARRWLYLMDQLDWVAAVFDPETECSFEPFNWSYACELGASVLEEVLAHERKL